MNPRSLITTATGHLAPVLSPWPVLAGLVTAATGFLVLAMFQALG